MPFLSPKHLFTKPNLFFNWKSESENLQPKFSNIFFYIFKSKTAHLQSTKIWSFVKSTAFNIAGFLQNEESLLGQTFLLVSRSAPQLSSKLQKISDYRPCWMRIQLCRIVRFFQFDEGKFHNQHYHSYPLVNQNLQRLWPEIRQYLGQWRWWLSKPFRSFLGTDQEPVERSLFKMHK